MGTVTNTRIKRIVPVIINSAFFKIGYFIFLPLIRLSLLIQGKHGHGWELCIRKMDEYPFASVQGLDIFPVGHPFSGKAGDLARFVFVNQGPGAGALLVRHVGRLSDLCGSFKIYWVNIFCFCG